MRIGRRLGPGRLPGRRPRGRRAVVKPARGTTSRPWRTAGVPRRPRKRYGRPRGLPAGDGGARERAALRRIPEPGPGAPPRRLRRRRRPRLRAPGPGARAPGQNGGSGGGPRRPGPAREPVRRSRAGGRGGGASDGRPRRDGRPRHSWRPRERPADGHGAPSRSAPRRPRSPGRRRGRPGRRGWPRGPRVPCRRSRLRESAVLHRRPPGPRGAPPDFRPGGPAPHSWIVPAPRTTTTTRFGAGAGKASSEPSDQRTVRPAIAAPAGIAKWARGSPELR